MNQNDEDPEAIAALDASEETIDVAKAICRQIHISEWGDGSPPWRPRELDLKVEGYWRKSLPLATAALAAAGKVRRARSPGLADDCAKIVEAKLALVTAERDDEKDTAKSLWDDLQNAREQQAAAESQLAAREADVKKLRDAIAKAQSDIAGVELEMDGNPELAAIRVGLSAALSTPVTEGPMVIGTDFAKNGSEATVYWPSPPPDCTDKESCARHGQCMYLGACSAAPVTEKDQSNDH